MIRTVIQQFDSVFASELALLPEKVQDHGIELEPGVGAINVTPYRYPQFQKDEIEKLVQEMLLSWVVQPSKSAFSSPVL